METRSAVPSAYNTISSNRSIGYSMPSAVADIIDNSISAGAKNIDLIAPSLTDPVLLIVDDGCGMDQDELDIAMTFGGAINCQEDRPKNDLGRFGMGLKTASLSQCTKLEVISKKDGSFVGGCWDLAYIKKYDTWDYIVISEAECRKKVKDTFLSDDEIASGTAVIWSHFDRLRESATNKFDEFSNQMSKTCKKLSLIFHRYLAGEEGINKIRITYNKNVLHPIDPFLTGEIAEVAKVKTIPLNNDVITVHCHKLPYPDKLTKEQLNRAQLEDGSTLLENQGFYVYRNKRLIDYGTWFGLASKKDKTKLSRIQIDIPNTLDSVWSLDIKKSRAIPPEKIRDDLKQILETNAIKSKKTYTTRARKKDSATYWVREVTPSNTIEYTINDDHPLIKDFKSKLTSEQQREFDFVLDNISKFFPFSKLELDQQEDKIIENERDEYQCSGLRENIELMVAYGYANEDIFKTFPDLEEDVGKILLEMGRL